MILFFVIVGTGQFDANLKTLYEIYKVVGETPSAEYLLQFLIDKTNVRLSSVSLPMLVEI